MRGVSAIVVAAATATMLWAPAAQAAAPTRAEFVAQADAICLAKVKEIEPPLNLLDRKLKRARVGRNASHRTIIRKIFRPYGQAFVLFGLAANNAVGAIAALTPPSADAALVAQWLDSIRVDAGNLNSYGTALKAGRLRAAQALENELIVHGQATDQIVSGFGFQYCAAPEAPVAPGPVRPRG